MSKAPSTEKPDFIEKIADHAGHILIVSVAAIIAAWSFYFFQFRGGLSDDTAIWGQFGDFVGGTLNSIFAFFSFVILLSSLRLQLKELRLTREELEATRQELAASSAAQKMQADHFDREAKKKDHIEAIEYMIKNIIDPSSFTILTLESEKENPQFITMWWDNPRFPTKIECSVYRDGSLKSSKENLINKIRSLEFLDFHCAELIKIYPQCPALLPPIRACQELAIRLESYGWITDLKFFGKHNFPLT